MKGLSAASVSRPIFTTMVTLIVVLLGAVSVTRLQIDLFPEVELPTLTVRTEYEGASPEVMERLVTQIEQIVATVPGVEEMTSLSGEGVSNVRVSFGWGTNLDAAAEDVRSRLESETDELPEDASRPQVRKFDVGRFPVVILGVSSPLDPVELTDLIERQVRHRFSHVPGVAQVDVFGGYEREVRVELDPARIRALNLPLNGILGAIRDANVDLPAGQIDRGAREVMLRAPAEFANLEEIRDTVVDVREGAPVTLGQIAAVRDTHRRMTRLVRVNGERGIRIGIRKRADANTVEVSRGVIEEIERANAEFPQIRIIPVVNQGNFIERSIDNVADSVLYGGGLAVLVLLFFLRNLRSTLVIGLSIPISIVATFALIYFGGFTLNLMTLGGLALGVGMMVDNSIVVLENIVRRRHEEGENPRDASIRGCREVASAIVASTLTTVVIFLPLVFMRGVSGVLFQEMAWVIVFSLLCSVGVALTLVPMLASRLLGEGAGPRSRIAEAAAASSGRLGDAYQGLVRAALRHRARTLAVAGAVVVAGFLLLPAIGTEFLPPSDEGQVRITGEMEPGTRLGLVDRQTRLLEELVLPAVEESVSSVVTVGASGFRPDEASQGEINLRLTASTDRARSNAEIAEDLRSRLEGRIPGMTIRVRAPQGQLLLNRLLGGDAGLTVEVAGHSLEDLGSLAQRAAEAIRDIPGISDVRLNRPAGLPQERIRVDRDKAADLGLTVREVSEALETAIAGRAAGEFRSGGDSYRILVRFAEAERLTLDEILDMTLVTPSGEEVAMRNIVSTEPGFGPMAIDRKDQQRLVTVSANVAGRDLGSVAEDAQRALAGIPRPPGHELRVAGDFEEQREAFRELLQSLALAILLVYMVLACQYESLRDPLIVMMSVPLAAIGVVAMLLATGSTLNLQSGIGCVMLAGIIVNNAILLVDQAGRLKAQGSTSSEAASEAARRRLRPILMTTLTTILGLVPLALGIGEGADAQAPLARAVIGGLVSSTLITLVLIPVLYALFHPDAKEARA